MRPAPDKSLEEAAERQAGDMFAVRTCPDPVRLLPSGGEAESPRQGKLPLHSKNVLIPRLPGTSLAPQVSSKSQRPQQGLLPSGQPDRRGTRPFGEERAWPRDGVVSEWGSQLLMSKQSRLHCEEGLFPPERRAMPALRCAGAMEGGDAPTHCVCKD